MRSYGQEYAYLTFGQLDERIQTLSETGQSTRVFEVAYWQKVFYPLSILVMLLLALPFAFMQTRKGGVGMRVFTGIMLGLVFFTLTALAQYLGALVTYSPILLAVAPNLVFLLIALIWLRRITRVA
jgi:lipopolysaccharide export system permease protein